MTDKNWRDVLARHDLTWDRMPAAWTGSAFLGNGFVGMMVYQEGEGGVRFDIGYSLVQDHRDLDESLGILLCRPRLPIGYFTLDATDTESGPALGARAICVGGCVIADAVKFAPV